MHTRKKVILIGLDGMSPEFVDRYKNKIPEIKKLLDFLEISEADIDLMIETVDRKLYRKRRA